MQCPSSLRVGPASTAHSYKLAFIVRLSWKDDSRAVSSRNPGTENCPQACFLRLPH